MGLFSWLRPAPPPVPVWTDEDLGTMRWSEDDDGWVGEYAGLPFSIARARTPDKSRPSPDLLAYAKRVLKDPAWRESCLDEAKRAAIAEYGAFYELEIRSLAYEFVHFYCQKTGPAIIADVGEGPRGRSWRIEFNGERCDGLGFDT